MNPLVEALNYLPWRTVRQAPILQTDYKVAARFVNVYQDRVVTYFTSEVDAIRDNISTSLLDGAQKVYVKYNNQFFVCTRSANSYSRRRVNNPEVVEFLEAVIAEV